MSETERIYLYPETYEGRNYIRQIGTKQDLERLNVVLVEDERLNFYCGDADDEGNRDDLYFEGTVHLDAGTDRWYVLIDKKTVRSASHLAS